MLLLAPRSLAGAFAGLFLVIVAAALIIPLAAAYLLRSTQPIAEYAFGVPGSLAVRGVTSTLSRTGVATAALAVAVATVIGVGLMIGSFRGSVERWLEATLLADIYANVADWEVAADSPLANPELRALMSLAGVRGVSLLQFARLPTVAGELSLRAITPGPDGWGLTVTDRVAGDALERLATGDGVMISEALAYRRELRVGTELSLPTQSGAQSFPILGIYREYNTDGGGVLLPMSLYQRHWQDRSVDGIGIYLDRAGDLPATRDAVREIFKNRPSVQLNSTETIRTRSLEIFDRTFRITEVLRILAGLVAFLGLLSALLAIELDRGKEIAVLRALGFTPAQVGTLALTQTLLLGVVAGLLAIPLGIAMAALLVGVINQRAFGWSMDFLVAPGPLLLGVSLATAAALLAGLYPAWRMSRASVVARLREE
jgi:putative ABC transport system permease protein